MKADLIDGLARATDSSENVPHLRRLVVALAISGKLDVSNDEESFARMGERLKAERGRLIKIGKLKRQEELASVSHEELPVEVSSACHFERLGNLAMLAKGLTGIQSAAPGRFPLVVTAEERSSCDHFDFDGAAAIVPMVSSAGHGKASIKRLHYQEGKFALGNILCAVFPISEEIISARFLYEYLTAFKEELLVMRMIGTANVSLTIGKIAEVPVPLVSRTIQRWVDELMVLCDRLEAAQGERESQRDRLAAASLHRLNNSADADAFRNHAHFYFNQLPRLTTRLEHIQQLRQTILTLAVRGKLVLQDPNDGPIEIMFKEQRSDKLPAIEQNELPFDIPPAWCWRRLGTVAELINGDRGKNYPNKNEYVQTGLPFINTGHIEPNGSLHLPSMHYISRQRFDLLRSGKIKPNDLVYCLRGTLGKTAFVVPFLEGAIASSLVIIRLQEPLNRRYLYYYLTSPLGRQLISRFDNGSAQPNLSSNSVKLYVVPLPPVAEQHRIVAKVEELMAICDRLEAQLSTTQTESRRLLEATLHGFCPTFTDT